MGKKLQGARLRAKQRAKVAIEELQEQQADVAAETEVSSRPDGELFVLDRTGGTVPHHKRPPRAARGDDLAAGAAKKQKRTDLSAHDLQLVDRLRQKHDAATIQDMADAGRKKLEGHRRPRLQAAQKTNTNFDLWEDNSNATETAVVAVKDPRSGVGSTLAGVAPMHVVVKAVPLSTKTRPAVVAVDVAKAGQSYHPDPVAHKALLQKAAAIEVARERVVRYREAPISQGMTAETRALLLGDSEDESSSEDEGGELEASGGTADIPAVGAIPKRSNKLTRAERNKQKRRRAEDACQRAAKRTKRLHNEVGEIPRYNKEIKRKAREQLEKQDERHQQMVAKLLVPKGKDIDLKVAVQDPLHAPTVPVALSDELKSSLRTIKPKGSLATDRLHSLADRSRLHKMGKTDEAQKRRKKSLTHRKKAVKGKHNSGYKGDDFEILG
jgi:nucleolar protein 53